MNAKVRALEKEIDANLGDSKGAELALKYLFASQKCWEKMSVWTEKFYQEMANATAVEPEEAWELVLHCWMAFFDDLREVRVACSGLSIGQTEPNTPERQEVVARYIWTIGKAIGVQNAYIDSQFKNHPSIARVTSIARVINYHIFHHKVPMSAFTKTTEEVKSSLKDLHSWKGNVNRQLNKLEAKQK